MKQKYLKPDGKKKTESIHWLQNENFPSTMKYFQLINYSLHYYFTRLFLQKKKKTIGSNQYYLNYLLRIHETHTLNNSFSYYYYYGNKSNYEYHYSSQKTLTDLKWKTP